MRMPAIALSAAGILGGCADVPPPDLSGRAAALAKVIATEQDHVSVAELSDWLIKDQRDFELVDIRAAAEFEEGQIPQARHIPLAGLLSDSSLASLPQGRRVVVYSNGTAHAAQAALLLRLVDRDAYALLGGFNHWRAYLNDPSSAGVGEMDAAEKARYQAVACFFAGDYLAEAGLSVRGAASTPQPAEGDRDPLGLGLGLGLGSDAVRAAAPAAEPDAAPRPADPLGLGLDLGLGSDAVRSRQPPPAPKPGGGGGRLLIKAEC